MDISAKGKLQDLCKELGIELTEEFNKASVARNGRVDVMFNGTEWRQKQQDYLELLAPLKDYGWKFETALKGFRVLPPKEPIEADPALGTQRKIGNIHDVVKLLDAPSEAWRSAKLRNNTVIVPNVGSEYHQFLLTNNVNLLERAGWKTIYNRSPRGGVESFELSPPVDYAPTADVKTALQRALRLPKVQAHWIGLGDARGTRSITFDKKVSAHAFYEAANAGRSLFATGWQMSKVEGVNESVTLIAPKSAIIAA